jgi:hypothetical protein
MTTSIGQIMTEKLDTIEASSSAQEAPNKMDDKKVSSLANYVVRLQDFLDRYYIVQLNTIN